MPHEIKNLRRYKGYPVPWFVEDVDGLPDFRVVSSEKRVQAREERLCWVCGTKMGANLVFPLGPMCCISRTSAELPCHRDCAIWSVKGCPFLTRPNMIRREDMPEGSEPSPGNMLMRNPGVTALWVTKTYTTFSAGPQRKDWLIEVGEPSSVTWYREGRTATHAEIVQSVMDGIAVTQKERPQTNLATDPGFQEALRVFTVTTGVQL